MPRPGRCQLFNTGEDTRLVAHAVVDNCLHVVLHCGTTTYHNEVSCTICKTIDDKKSFALCILSVAFFLIIDYFFRHG